MFMYNKNKRTPIFTPKKIPDGFKRAQENERIANVIEQIGKLYGDISNPPMVQIFVHSERCGVCRDSIQLWKNIVAELTRVLPTYNGLDIEFDKPSTFGDSKLNGEQIYKFFKMTGVPFVIQNFKIEQKSIRGNKYNAVMGLNKFFVSYEGAIAPYGFLSKIFKVENEFVKRLSSG